MERLTYYLMKGSENDGWYLKPGVTREEAITHWMPLPRPPKEEV